MSAFIHNLATLYVADHGMNGFVIQSLCEGWECFIYHHCVAVIGFR